VLDYRTIEQLAKLYGGLPLIGCLPGSPADRAGLRFGDIVISVNGMPTRDADEFVAAKGFRDGRMSIVVIRNGAELLIELTQGSWNAETLEDGQASQEGASLPAVVPGKLAN
jgi:S1-C subfamily serine protease